MKIFADRSEELTPHLVVHRQLRIKVQFSTEIDRPGRGEANVGRAQKQLIDRYDAGADVKFDLGLFQMELHQFVDLQDLTERDEETVLLQFAIAEDNFAVARERVAVSCLSARRREIPLPGPE